MYSKLFCLSNSKFSVFLCSVFLAMGTLLQTSKLEAGGWGKTDEFIVREGIMWNGVFFDNNGLNFSAYVPNSSGAVFQNGTVSLEGEVEDAGYAILTTYNPGFTPPGSIQGFLKMIQDANPEYNIHEIDAKKIGAKYVVDLTPINNDQKAYWRFLTTKDRLIKMGSDDSDESRRRYFFESLIIH